MLILSRKRNESVMIADDIEVTVMRLSGDRVTLALRAPRNVQIVRSELAGCPRKSHPGVKAGERCKRFGCQAALDASESGVYCPRCGWNSTRDD